MFHTYGWKRTWRISALVMCEMKQQGWELFFFVSHAIEEHYSQPFPNFNWLITVKNRLNSTKQHMEIDALYAKWVSNIDQY